MAIKIALQTSTIELEVKGVDAGGNKASFWAGFKRFPQEESENKLKELQELLAVDEEGRNKHTKEEQDNFILDNVVYLKGVKLVDEDELGNIKKLPPIEDTRKVKSDESLWGDASNACSFLLRLHLDSAPWRLSIILELQKALFNRDLEYNQKN